MGRSRLTKTGTIAPYRGSTARLTNRLGDTAWYDGGVVTDLVQGQDATAVLAAGGRFGIRPLVAPRRPDERADGCDVRRLADSPVQETTWTTRTGTLRAMTAMITSPRPAYVCMVECVAGNVEVEAFAEGIHDALPGRAYWPGQPTDEPPFIVTWEGDESALVLVTDLADPGALVDPADSSTVDRRVHGQRILAKGERAFLVLIYGAGEWVPSKLEHVDHALEHLRAEWRRWAGPPLGAGPDDRDFKDGVTLRSLTDALGRIVPAAGARLPGGRPNPRRVMGDQAWVAMGVAACGFVEDGADDVLERVRHQLEQGIEVDSPGRLLELLKDRYHAGRLLEKDLQLVGRLADQAVETWNVPDGGFWKEGPDDVAHVGSMLECYVGLQAAWMIASRKRVMEDARRRWAAASSAILAEVRRLGFGQEGCLMQSFGSTRIDAAVLLAAGIEVGFSPEQHHANVKGVVAALIKDGLLLPYTGAPAPSALATIMAAVALARIGDLKRGRELLGNARHHLDSDPDAASLAALVLAQRTIDQIARSRPLIRPLEASGDRIEAAGTFGSPLAQLGRFMASDRPLPMGRWAGRLAAGLMAVLLAVAVRAGVWAATADGLIGCVVATTGTLVALVGASAWATAARSRNGRLTAGRIAWARLGWSVAILVTAGLSVAVPAVQLTRVSNDVNAVLAEIAVCMTAMGVGLGLLLSAVGVVYRAVVRLWGREDAA